MLKEFDTWYKMAFVGGEEVEEEDTSEMEKEPKKDKTKKVQWIACVTGMNSVLVQ